jgi:PleD family two-component response regulator
MADVRDDYSYEGANVDNSDLGNSEIGREFENLDELMIRADNAMYTAKSMGFNRIEISLD